MLFWLTKKPAKSMNGMISTGVLATATCLSEIAAPRVRPNAEVAATNMIE